MSTPQDIIRFPAGKRSDIAIKSFMIFHAFSVASLIFAGWVGVTNATTPQMLAIAALISTILSLGLTFILHVVINARRKTSNDPDMLRLTPHGIEGRALAENGIQTLAWCRIERVEHNAGAVTVHFTPTDLSSVKTADRISAVRIPKTGSFSTDEMATALKTHLT